LEKENNEKDTTTNNSSDNDKKSVWAWVWAILSVIYTVSPVDLIPDIPVIGWVDDFFILTSVWLNLAEKNFTDVHSSLKSILKTIKWIVIGVGIIVVLLIILLGTAIIKLATG